MQQFISVTFFPLGGSVFFSSNILLISLQEGDPAMKSQNAIVLHSVYLPSLKTPTCTFPVPFTVRHPPTLSDPYSIW